MRRWIVAVAALTAGGAVSAGVLAAANPSRGEIDAWSAARAMPAGTEVTPDSITATPINPGPAGGQLFTRSQLGQLVGLRASHDLAAGQLIQRGDVTESTGPADRRLVFVPIKDVPPAGPGSKVDLLVVGGLPDSPAVQTFATGVEVSSIAPGGLILVVSSQQASAFVFAGVALNLVAVIAEPGSPSGGEVPVSTPEQALEVASH